TLPLPSRSTLFPYTTLFRSSQQVPFVPPSIIAQESAVDASKVRAPFGTDLRCFSPIRGLVTSSSIWNVVTRRARASRHSAGFSRSEEHTSELQSLRHLVCRL